MISLRAIAIALLLAAPVPAVAQASAQDAQRIALIEGAKAAVVHVKVPKAPASKGAPGPGRSRVDLDPLIDSLRDQLGVPKVQEGTGFIVDARRGLILTAAHIVAGASALRVALADGSERDASVAGVDEDSGIALLRVAGPLAAALELSSREPRAGETAVIVGFMLPVRAVLALDGMVTGPIPADGMKSRQFPALVDYVALDIVIPNGGFGGSPVLDSSGKVVGLVSAILGHTYGGGSLTLMIPGHQVAPIVAEIAERGPIRRSRVGIDFNCEPTPCEITSVHPASTAAAAGLRVNDRILAVDGRAIASDVALRRAVASKPVGGELTIRVERQGRQFDLKLHTSAAP